MFIMFASIPNLHNFIESLVDSITLLLVVSRSAILFILKIILTYFLSPFIRLKLYEYTLEMGLSFFYTNRIGVSPKKQHKIHIFWHITQKMTNFVWKVINFWYFFYWMMTLVCQNRLNLCWLCITNQFNYFSSSMT